MIRCFIGLGSNRDDPENQIQRALQALSFVVDSKVVCISPRYRNPAVGPGQQPDYINAVAELHTTLDALTLLQQMLAIELAQGRVRTTRWGARTLDLDLLLYGNAVIDLPQLQVPHPRMIMRNFVLHPLYDLHPDLVMPDGTSLRALLDCCPSHALERL
jgi:2-amino-4-hydroxy-6-hydroxymethyldihydropteridine diphosphokinase